MKRKKEEEDKLCWDKSGTVVTFLVGSLSLVFRWFVFWCGVGLYVIGAGLLLLNLCSAVYEQVEHPQRTVFEQFCYFLS